MVLALSMMVNAFGVGSPYWEGFPLTMYPGETQIIDLNLQNKAGATEDVTASVEIIEGTEIATLDENEYLVEAGGATNVPLKIKIPSDAELGAVYKIKVSTKTITPGTTGGVSMGVGMTTNFEVIIGEKPEGETTNAWTWYLIAGIVLLAIVIIFFLVKKAKRKK